MSQAHCNTTGTWIIAFVLLFKLDAVAPKCTCRLLFSRVCKIQEVCTFPLSTRQPNTSFHYHFWVCWYGTKWLSSPSHSAFYYRWNMLDHGECSYAWIKRVKLMRSLTSRVHSLHSNSNNPSLVKVCDNPLNISSRQGHCERERWYGKDLDTPMNYRVHRQLLDDDATNSKKYTTTIQMNKIDITP